MSQERGSANQAAIMAIGLLSLMLCCASVNAATYVVGGPGGWTFNMVNWPTGKHFKAGDMLVFKYSPSAHNVVVVNKPGYDGCTTPGGAKVYRTGNDQIKLGKGMNYYICNFAGHCGAGMKLAINAL